MDAELDLLPGQLDSNDKKPSDYASPQGNFLGIGYKLDGEEVKPVYQKIQNTQNLFVQPAGFRFDEEFKLELKNFIFSQHPVIVYPQRIGQDVVIGVNHKLNKLEEANNMLAYRNFEFVSLDDIEVKRIIMERFQELNGSGLYQKSTVDNLLPLTPLEVKDETTGIHVASFKNGITNDTIDKIYHVDINQSTKAVQRLVKVPVNRNQIMALISLAFDVDEKVFFKSKMLNVLNAGKYNEAVSYFMDFSEMRMRDGRIGISQNIYNRRLSEAKLFAKVI